MTSTIGDEQALALADFVARDLFDATWTTEHRRKELIDAGRSALEAYERTRAPDPRVVELVTQSWALVEVMELYSLPRKIVYAQKKGIDSVREVEEFMTETHARFRAALTAMENGK